MTNPRILLGCFALLSLVASSVDGQEKKPALINEGRSQEIGVVARSQNDGAVILAVAKDSLAAKAGFEVGDIIHSVDNFTIGLIDGVDYPLHSEVRRIRGVGMFEITNHQTKKVAKVEIKLGDVNFPPVEVSAKAAVTPAVPPALPR